MFICDNSFYVVDIQHCVQVAGKCGLPKLSRCRDACIGGNIILLVAMAIMFRQEVANEYGVGNRVMSH